MYRIGKKCKAWETIGKSRGAVSCGTDTSWHVEKENNFVGDNEIFFYKIY